MVDVKEVVSFFPTFFIIIIIISLFSFTKGDLSSFLIRIITSKFFHVQGFGLLRSPWLNHGMRESVVTRET